MLSVIMLSVVRLSVIMLSVVAPFKIGGCRVKDLIKGKHALGLFLFKQNEQNRAL
jgi:hypothetical protein